jgi:hypothetical protein
MKKKTTSAPSERKTKKTRDLSPLEKKSSSIKAGKRRSIRGRH